MSRSSAPPIARNGKRPFSRTAGASPRAGRCSTSSTRKNGSDGPPNRRSRESGNPELQGRGRRPGAPLSRGRHHPVAGDGEVFALPAQGCDNFANKREGTGMTDATTEPVKIDGYHAHVYYDAETRSRAERLRETIADTLGVEVREL